MSASESTKPRTKQTALRLKYSVSFEFDLRPPLTHTGIIEGWAASTCARRAIEEAQEVLRPVNWTSMVCVFLERLSALDDEAPQDALGPLLVHDHPSSKGQGL